MTNKELLNATGRIAQAGDIPTAIELERLGRAISFWSFWKGWIIGTGCGIALSFVFRAVFNGN